MTTILELEDAKLDVAHVENLDVESFKYDSSKVHAGMDAELARMVAQGQAAHVSVQSPEESTRLRRMINKRVLLVMLVTYFFQGLDKGTIGFASIMGIRKDAHLVGQQYSWLTTIFYLAALFSEYPMNRIVQRYPIGKVLGIFVTLWGAILACTAACTNFRDLMIVRFLLGVAEASVQPSFLILTSMWYKRSEQGEVVSYWYGMNGLQQAIGGLLAYGINHYQNHAIKSWQLLFMALGLVTVAWGLFMLYWLPDSPMRAKCWSEDDRMKMIERVRENQTGLQNKTYKWYQFREALRDPALALLFITNVANTLCSGGNSAFSNIVISSFGFSTLQTYLLNIPQGVVIVITCLLPAYLARRYQQTIWVMIGSNIPLMVGVLVIMKIVPDSSNRVGLLIAYYCILSLNGVAVLLYGLVIRNIGGRTKQASAIVIVFLGWAAGNCIGPQVFRSSDAPRYKTGFAVYLACACLQMAALFGLRMLYVFRNSTKKTLRMKLRDGDDAVKTDQAFDDLTDMENPDFVYHV